MICFLLIFSLGWLPPEPKPLTTPITIPSVAMPDHYKNQDDSFSLRFYFKNIPTISKNIKIYRSPDNRESCDGYLHYAPYKTTQCPDGKQCVGKDFGLNGDAWICFGEGRHKCYPAGYHQLKMVQKPIKKMASTLDKQKPIEYTISGQQNYEFNVRVLCNRGVDFIPPESVNYTNENGIERFSIELAGKLFCVNNYVDPPKIHMERAQPTPDPSPINIEENINVYEKTLVNYINYSLADFEDFNFEIKKVSAHGTMYVNQTFFVSFKNRLPCPSGYICQFNDTLKYGTASIWHCHTGIFDPELKECSPVGDMGHGFTLQTNKIDIAGGALNWHTIFNLVCDENVSRNQMVVKTGTSSEQNNQIRITAHTGASCPQNIVQDIFVKKATPGGYFVTIIWIILTILCAGGIMLNYAINDSLGITGWSIWADIGDFINQGWKIATFYKEEPSVVVQSPQRPGPRHVEHYSAV